MSSRKRQTIAYLKLILQAAVGFIFLLAIIFIPAGQLDYWQGWGLIGITLITVSVQIVAFSDKADLTKERMKPGPGTKWWDKVFWGLYAPTFFAIPIIAGFDVGRYKWTVPLPLTIYTLGYLAFVFSLFLYSWAMWVNRFFSSVVRIQMDREQEVVQVGPYRFIRHPGYVAGSLMATGMAIILGSLWALVPAGAILIMLVIRTYLEDSTLQRELPGYIEYTKKVRYRLIPGVW